MDFLGNSIISKTDQSVLGVMITHFNGGYIDRADIKFYGCDDFKNVYSTLNPSGFELNSKGVLLSDTQVRSVITDSLFSYLEQECSKMQRTSLDIVDFVLHGVHEKAYVIANYKDIISGQMKPMNLGESEDVECPPDSLTLEDSGIYIPFHLFKVSNSSFNIYASYQIPSGAFRTYSLLNVEDGSKTTFWAAFPEEADLSMFGNKVQVCNHVKIGMSNFIIYKVELGLEPYYASVGEGFLNYLAYNVSFYNIGEVTLKSLMPKLTTVTKVPVDRKKREPRKASKNVSIEHQYRYCRFSEITEMLANGEDPTPYIQDNAEADITYQWICQVYKSPWYCNKSVDEGDDRDRLQTACVNLLTECRKTRLKYALELLDHRFSIACMGRSNDLLDIILKGGGVSGQSAKRLCI